MSDSLKRGFMEYFDTGELRQKQVLEGITLRSVYGESAMMTFFDLDEGAVIPPHRHMHEQISYVLEGELEFTLEGEKRVLSKGQGVVVHADVEHSAIVTKGPAKALDA